MTTARQELLAESADALEKARPDLAQRLRALARLKPPGPKSKRDPYGYTDHDYRLAGIALHMATRIEGGEFEGDVLADIVANSKPPISEERLARLRAFDGFAHIRRLLNNPHARRIAINRCPDFAGEDP